jgi:hypothetical protein
LWKPFKDDLRGATVVAWIDADLVQTVHRDAWIEKYEDGRVPGVIDP